MRYIIIPIGILLVTIGVAIVFMCASLWYFKIKRTLTFGYPKVEYTPRSLRREYADLLFNIALK